MTHLCYVYPSLTYHFSYLIFLSHFGTDKQRQHRIGGTDYRLRFRSIDKSLDLGLLEQVLYLVDYKTTIPYPISRFVLSLPDPELRRPLRIRLPKEVCHRLWCQNSQHRHGADEAQGKVFLLIGWYEDNESNDHDERAEHLPLLVVPLENPQEPE